MIDAWPVEYDEQHDVTFYRARGMETDEMVIQNPDDGGYSAYIDASLTEEQEAKKRRHVIRHLLKKHFGADDVQKIEAEAHSEKELEIVKEQPVQPKIKHKWAFTYFDLYMLKTFQRLRDYFGLELEDLPDEPLFPPKHFDKGRNIPKEYRESMPEMQLIATYEQYGMYDRLEEIYDSQMAKAYAEIMFGGELKV